jgi:hypothetical protein
MSALPKTLKTIEIRPALTAELTIIEGKARRPVQVATCPTDGVIAIQSTPETLRIFRRKVPDAIGRDGKTQWITLPHEMGTTPAETIRGATGLVVTGSTV